MKQGLLISAVLILMLAYEPAVPDARAQTDLDSFTPAQYRWAVNWTNGPLETLMAHGIIETISTADKKFQVLAGEAWQQLSFSQVGEILSKLSRARQITGHSPFFTVKQRANEIVLARVTQHSISVLMPGEGFIEYIPETDIHENTVY